MFSSYSELFVKSRPIEPTHLHLSPHWCDPVRILQRSLASVSETRFPGLSCSVGSVILRLAVLRQNWCMLNGRIDGQTDGRTDGRMDGRSDDHDG